MEKFEVEGNKVFIDWFSEDVKYFEIVVDETPINTVYKNIK